MDRRSPDHKSSPHGRTALGIAFALCLAWIALFLVRQFVLAYAAPGGPGTTNFSEPPATRTAQYNAIQTAVQAAVVAAASTPFVIPASNTMRSADYRAGVTYNPQDAKYYSLVNDTFHLLDSENRHLQSDGFVVSDRLSFKDYRTAYAWIFKHDLPVVVTTDSILHAIHQTYDDGLKALEESIFLREMRLMLQKSVADVQAQRKLNTDRAIDALYAKLETYLTVPLALLDKDNPPEQTAEVAGYIAQIKAANTTTDFALFGTAHEMDWTRFTPRGHYADSYGLPKYFQALTWLGLAQFPLVETDRSVRLNREGLAAATLLYQSFVRSGAKVQWDTLERAYKSLAGSSDQTTLDQFGAFLIDAKMSDESALLKGTNDRELLDLLRSGRYGKPRISTMGMTDEQVDTPVSLALFGGRYTVDADIFSKLTYNKLIVNGEPVPRAYPVPLDAMAALGNPRAQDHLKSEFAAYGYQGVLNKLTGDIAALPPETWTDSFYARTLNLIRSLNIQTTESQYSQSMQTAAWADKMLQTQLSAWTQLRHDNVAYVAPSYTNRNLCDYPAGYVEPYTAFYAAVMDYAQAGKAAMNALTITAPVTRIVRAGTPTPSPDERDYYYASAITTRDHMLTYFDNLGRYAATLKMLSEKELTQTPFTDGETAFVRSIVRRKVIQNPVTCTKDPAERWDGWYLDLLPFGTDVPMVVADVHTNTNAEMMGPPGVLHTATGYVSVMLFIGKTDPGQTLYVGPAFSYYEALVKGYPPTPLTDTQWMSNLNGIARPTAPEWTESFRISSLLSPPLLDFPPLSADQIEP